MTSEHRKAIALLPSIVLASILFLGLWPALSPANAAPPAERVAPRPPDPSVIRSDDTGLVLEWRAPLFSQQEVLGEDGYYYIAMDADGWSQTDTPGQPQLPYATALIVVPPTGAVSINVETLESSRQALAHPVIPSMQPVVVSSPARQIEFDWAYDQSAYGGDLVPRGSAGVCSSDASVTLEEAGWMRGRRLVQVTFSPFCFEPVRLTSDGVNGPVLAIADLVRIELSFEDQVSQDAAWTQDDPFTPILQNTVINPGQATRFARPPRASAGLNRTQTAGYPPANTEYLIISHSDFSTAIAPLAAHRSISDSLNVYTATVQTIYSLYPSLDPHLAIREYISHTYYSTATPMLDYVLLVGDGSDESTDTQYVPPFPVTLCPPWASGFVNPCFDAPADNRYATIDGTDLHADVFIGRLPVNTAAEATTVVNKILTYELNPPAWPWNEWVLFFAGHEDVSFPMFHDDSNSVYASLPTSFTGRRAYFCTTDVSSCNQSHLYTNMNDARTTIMNLIDAGGLLVSYVGHSSWQQWDYEPGTFAPMLHANDHVPSLRNGGALPVFLGMTCYTSRFSRPDGEITLDEALLRRSGGGAIATWGSTDLGLSNGHKVLHTAFYEAVFVDDVTALGPIIAQAKAQLGGTPNYQDLYDTFLLLGDPALELNMAIVPWSDGIYLPLVMKGY